MVLYFSHPLISLLTGWEHSLHWGNSHISLGDWYSVAFDPWCQVHFFIKQKSYISFLALLKYHKLDGITQNNRHVSSHSAGGQKSEIQEVPWGWFLLEALRKNLFHAFLLLLMAASQHFTKNSNLYLSIYLVFFPMYLCVSDLLLCLIRMSGHWI